MQTFFGEADYAAYRTWVAEGCKTAGVDILAYCLIPNHAQFIVVPSQPMPCGLPSPMRFAVIHEAPPTALLTKKAA